MRCQTALSRVALRAVVALAGCTLGCARQGSVAFVIESPDAGVLSPMADSRQEQAEVFFDGPSGQKGIGSPVFTHRAPQSIGDIPIGRYDLRLVIQGGSQLIGMGRASGVDIRRGIDETIAFQVRKPLLFYQASAESNLSPTPTTPPGPLMAWDTTGPDEPSLPDVPLPAAYCPNSTSCPGASATTADGRYVFMAIPGQLLVLDSGRLYPDGGVVAVATITGNQGTPAPRRMVVSPDGKWVALATDQGLNLASVADLVAGRVAKLPKVLDLPGTSAIPAGGASALAFALDSAALTVLAGPILSNRTSGVLTCDPGITQQAVYYSLVPGAPPSSPLAAPAPDKATDVFYTHAGKLAFALPCSAGPQLEGSTDPLLAAPGAARMAIAVGLSGARFLVAVPQVLTPAGSTMVASVKVLPLSADSNVVLPSTTFNLPTELVTFHGGTNPPPLTPGAQVAATNLVVTDLAISPDLGRALLAAQVTYDDPSTASIRFPNPDPSKPAWFSCKLGGLSRSVYYLIEVDFGSGKTRVRRTGTSDTSECSWSCDCPTCTPPVENQMYTCKHDADGFIPSGLSLIFGSL